MNKTTLHHSPKALHHIATYPSSPKSKTQTYYYKGSNLFRLSNIEFKKRLFKTAKANPLNVIQIYGILGYLGNLEKNKSKINICKYFIRNLYPVLEDTIQIETVEE